MRVGTLSQRVPKICRRPLELVLKIHQITRAQAAQRLRFLHIFRHLEEAS